MFCQLSIVSLSARVKMCSYVIVRIHMHMCVGKPTELSHLVCQEIPITNTEATVAFLC